MHMKGTDAGLERMLTRAVGAGAEGAGGLACSTAAPGPGACKCVSVCSAASLLTSMLHVAVWQVVGSSRWAVFSKMCSRHEAS